MATTFTQTSNGYSSVLMSALASGDTIVLGTNTLTMDTYLNYGATSTLTFPSSTNTGTLIVENGNVKFKAVLGDTSGSITINMGGQPRGVETNASGSKVSVGIGGIG